MKLLKAIARKLAHVMASIIIFISIIITVTYLLQPVLDKHRPDIEKWASQLLNMPVTIANVRLSWYHYQPEIRLKEVTILNKETKEPALQIQRIGIILSISQSLWQRTIVPSGVMITGANLNLLENAKGEVSVQGFPTLNGFGAQPYKAETKFTDVMVWLSQQPRLMLHDVDIRYTGVAGLNRFVTLYNLNFENSGASHEISGKAILHQDTPTEVTLGLQWQGQKPDLATIKANIYLYVSGLSLDQWLLGRTWQGWQIKSGMLSAKIWANWSEGTFQKIQSTLQSYNVSLYSQTNKSTHKINRISGNIGWRRQDNTGQVYAGDDILIDLPTHLWPVSSFYVSLVPDANGVLSPKAADLGYVDLHDIQSFLFASPAFIPDTVQKALTGMRLEGSLQDSVITFSGAPTDWSQISVTSTFAHLSVAPWMKWPGLKNLSGTMKWDGKQGAVTFASNGSEFQYASIFDGALNLDQLTGEVIWEQDQKNNAWVVSTSSLQLLNSDIAANIKGSLTFLADTSPVADIAGNFTLQNANHITRYLPMRTFEAGLQSWIRSAFLSGSVQSGHAILRGKLADFPFDKNNGEFLIAGNVKDIEMSYAPDWPLLRHINGMLTFAGRQMTIELDQAETLGIPVTNIHAEILHFGDNQPQILTVQTGQIQSDFTQGLHYVHSSPLEKNIGKMFSGVEMHGPMLLTLGLTVPLKNPEAIQVRGDLILKEMQMDLVPWNLNVNKLSGQVQFTESTTTAKNIQGELFNKPLQFDLSTVQQSKNISVVRANFTNNISVKDLEDWLAVPFSKVVQGATDIKGQIDFSLKTPIIIQLQSNLVGLAVKLPDQYGKSADKAVDFSTEMTVMEGQPLRIKLSYNNLFSAAFILERKKEKFNLLGANLLLGKGNIEWPIGAGLYITGNFDVLDWDKIKGYMEHPSNKSDASLGLPQLPLRGVNINAGRLNIAGLQLNQIHIQAMPSTTYWEVNVNSPAIIGQLRIPMRFTREGSISAQFQKLSLNAASGGGHGLGGNVSSFPAISFMANNVSYNNIPLGQVAFNTTPSQDGLLIQMLRITSASLNFEAVGNWLQNGSAETTNLQGTATSKNVSDLLTSFGLDVRNFVSSDGKLTFNVNWHDAPYAPALASMNGKVSLKFGKGRIVDIGQENGAKMDFGRMLSIFSLQTIPRRLSLDFSDVFQKGYSFDTMRGDFSLQNGNAYTNNFLFDGPVARVGIDGRIGLKSKDFNFTLIVTPYVTSSLPVAASLMGGPLVGLAAFAVNTVIGSQVSKVITYYYDVRGPWSNPTWKSVKVDKNA